MTTQLLSFFFLTNAGNGCQIREAKSQQYLASFIFFTNSPCLTFHPKVFKQYGYLRDWKVEGTVGQGVGWMLNGKARPATASFFLKRKFLSFQVILSQRSAHRGSRFLPALIRHANTPHPEVNSDPSPERMSSNWFIKKLPNFPFSHSFFPPIPHRMGFSVLAFFFKLESTCIGLHIKVELHLQSCEGCFDVVVALASAALQRLIPPRLPSTVYEKCYIGWRFVPKRRRLLFTQATHKNGKTRNHTCACEYLTYYAYARPVWPRGFNVCLKSSRSDLEMYSSTRRLSKNHRRLFHVQQTAYGDSKFVRYSPIKLKTATTAPMEHEPCWLLLLNINQT